MPDAYEIPAFAPTQDEELSVAPALEESVEEPVEEAQAADEDALEQPVNVRLSDDFDVPEDSEPVKVSVAGVSVELPADGASVEVVDAEARILEESPAVTVEREGGE